MGTSAVPYDDEQTAYMAMFEDLDKAIAGLKSAQGIPRRGQHGKFPTTAYTAATTRSG